MNNSGLTNQQRKAVEHTAPGTQLHPQLVGISCVVDYVYLSLAAVEAPGLFLAHLLAALMEIGAFAQWCHGYLLSTIPHDGQIWLERQ